MTLLVRNEADLIRDNIDYHLAQGVDLVIVTDHGSTDETPQLLREYERSGAVVVLRDEGHEHHQSRRVTRMARLAGDRYAADWVIHNDADEFWWPLAGTLRDVFAAIPDGYGQVEVTQRYNFRPGASIDGPFHARLLHREARSSNLVGRPLESKVAHRPHPAVTVAPGNHRISGGQLRPAPVADMLEIFHFPMRSYEQFERKVVQIGEGYEALDDRSPDVGRDQLALLAIQREGGLPGWWDIRRLRDEALDRALADGTVVRDERLARFMANLRAGTGDADGRAAGPATRALVGDALRSHAALDDARAQAELADRELAAARAQLAVSLDQLERIRASRLMRLTAPLRRRWYRLRGR